ncbi:5-methylcytosine restriction system specificity protein McrC [Rhodanobacter sp. UC4450_H17]
MLEIIECEEFGDLSIRVSALLKDGELRLDERITTRGYLSATLKGGQITLRTTKYVGTIPLTADLSVRVKPRATISNLSYMLVRSGVIPTAISSFSRGYLPRFTTVANVERVFGRSLVDGAKLIAKRGFMKEYIRPLNPSPWRGRLLASDTIRRHASKGVRYRHEFDLSILSPSIIENIALKSALTQTTDWFQRNDRRNPIIAEAKAILHDLWPVAVWDGMQSDLVTRLSQRIRALSPRLPHYRDPLWASLLILQNSLPDIAFDGFVRLDSLIVDVSAVFEAFLRRELADRLRPLGYEVQDGNRTPRPLFTDAGQYSVHPDIIIWRDGSVVALLDVKYKPSPKEQDRYEVLSFMDAMGVSVGGFVCPAVEEDTSRYVGETASGKKFFSIRYDLAVVDPDAESDRFAENVIRMLVGSRDFD